MFVNPFKQKTNNYYGGYFERLMPRDVGYI